jgi:hypothetical protein
MYRQRGCRVALTVALLLFPCSRLLAAQSQVNPAPAHSDEDLEWLNQHGQAEVERLMPMSPPPSDGVVVRSYRDLYFEVKERFFRIERNYDSMPHVLRAVVLAPRGRSIQQQLLELHVADRSASLEELRARLQVDRFERSEKTCPAVRKAIESLKKLRVSLPTQNVFIIHPQMFRVIAAFGDGQIDATLLGSDHVLARWGVATYDALLACAPEKPSR